MSAKTGIKKIARRIQRKHRNVFFSDSLKDLELKLWVNDINSKPSLHLGKRGAWNLLRIAEYPEPKIGHLAKRRRSSKILPRNVWYSLSY